MWNWVADLVGAFSVITNLWMELFEALEHRGRRLDKYRARDGRACCLLPAHFVVDQRLIWILMCRHGAGSTDLQYWHQCTSTMYTIFREDHMVEKPVYIGAIVGTSWKFWITMSKKRSKLNTLHQSEAAWSRPRCGGAVLYRDVQIEKEEKWWIKPSPRFNDILLHNFYVPYWWI